MGRSVLTSGLTFNFNQVEIKGTHASQSELYILRKNYPHSKTSLWIVMSTSAPILSADFPHVIAAGHAEDFQIYVFE